MTQPATVDRDLFDFARSSPSGLSYWPDAFSQSEESAWVQEIEALPFKPFEFHGYLGKRRIVSFGWRYDYAGRALRASEPLPTFLEVVAPTRCRLSLASMCSACGRRWSPNMTRA